ncbi:MAG TPA: hypothetical protein VHS96_11575 [Bacteroidia bacterium]|nr:hypothetical protein [Bacteroidia bacterium]
MRLTFTVLVMLTCGLVRAQQLPQAALVEAEAKFKALTTYSATMGYTMSGHHDIGKVYYSGLKYHFDYPEDQTIFDGKTTMNWNKEFASISYPQPGEGPDLSAGGIYGVHRFGYDFAWTDSSSVMRRMKLTPKGDGAALYPIKIGIGRKSGLIEEYTIDIRPGFSIGMQVLDFQLNPVLDEKLFIIDWAFVKRVEDGLVPPVEHGHDAPKPDAHEGHEGHEHDGHDHD